jgi:hypothetical protein
VGTLLGHAEELGDLDESYPWECHRSASHWLDLEGQPVDLAWGVWPLDVALDWHQLDLRLPENAHVASLDG